MLASGARGVNRCFRRRTEDMMEDRRLPFFGVSHSAHSLEGSSGSPAVGYMYEVVERTVLEKACIAPEKVVEMALRSFLGERSGELSAAEVMKVVA